MLILSLIFVLYDLLVISLIIGWKHALLIRYPLSKKQLRISIIIAVRNEEANIDGMIAALSLQSYPNFEVVIVDDHSTDRSFDLLSKNLPLNGALLRSNGDGKKQAISTGVKNASGEIIVTMDADCTPNPAWLTTINNAFHNENLKMAFGPVKIFSGARLFGHLQSMEFATLIGSGAATAGLGYPTMCNGANLAYRKNVFEEVDGYRDNLHVDSGDDEFLMRKIHALYPKGIQFIASRDAVVMTKPQKTFWAFFQQRLRWAGKWRYNNSLYTVILALFIVLAQMATVLAIVSLVYSFNIWLLTLLLVKVMFEGLFLIFILSFFKSTFNPLSFLILQVFYPLYVLVVAFASNVYNPSWKDRKVNR